MATKWVEREGKVVWNSVPDDPDALLTAGEWGLWAKDGEYELNMRGLVSCGSTPAAEELRTLARDLAALAEKVAACEAGSAA
jgi:hypothetical protein